MSELHTLGDYKIIKQIGQGALGTVYLAEHRFMKKQFALKVLPEELSSDNRAFIQRFEDEIGILANLDHPHIAKMHNISHDAGNYFLVTDCIVDEMGETTNLGQYMLAQGERSKEDDIYGMIRQIADALDYAHNIKVGGHGIPHSGIKLSNILVSKGKEGVNLHLTDFGLTRIIGTGAFLSRTYKVVAETLGLGTAIQSTNAGVDSQKLIPLHASFLQSYLFLAPEQKRLDSPHSVDAKADNYAFGVLAYYLLMKEYAEGFFEMPSERRPSSKYDWDQLIRSCMHRDPTKRAKRLLDVLNAITNKIETKKMETQQVVRQQTAEVEQLRPVIHVAQLERPEHDPDPARAFQIDTSVKQYRPEQNEVKNTEPLRTEMVIIKGGTFYRGSNDGNRDEMPYHRVTLSGFAIDIHPVTNEQFVRFLEAMGGEKDTNHRDIIRFRDSRIKRSCGKLSIESGYVKHPVVGITWYGAVAYAKWVGKRLPTEAEWEIAACGGAEEATYPTGEDIEKSQANFFSSDTIAIMSYAPNSNGLYDMAGNVYEWCQDWYGYNYYETSVQEPENPQGTLQGVYRVLRGGCWKSLKEDLRCSKRHRNNPGTVNSTYGFRCTADVE